MGKIGQQLSSDNLVYCQRNFFLGLMVLGHPSQICLLPIYGSFKKKKKNKKHFYVLHPSVFTEVPVGLLIEIREAMWNNPIYTNANSCWPQDRISSPMKLVLHHIPHQLGLVILIYFLKSEFSCPGSQHIYKKHFFL